MFSLYMRVSIDDMPTSMEVLGSVEKAPIPPREYGDHKKEWRVIM